MKIKKQLRQYFKPKQKFDGFVENRQNIAGFENLSDSDLEQLNQILEWNSFVVDQNGRRFGNMAWAGKRDLPSEIPDRRHELLSERIDLSQKSVLEIGCFEGLHTISLCGMARNVTAIDARVENVVKTMVRCGFFQCKPRVVVCNVESDVGKFESFETDFCHHFGVLYHLKDPVNHIFKLGNIVKDGIFLDTHIADPDTQDIKQSSHAEIDFDYYEYRESTGVFAGMYATAQWLTLTSLEEVLRAAGFINFELIENRSERNGKRILALATK